MHNTASITDLQASWTILFIFDVIMGHFTQLVGIDLVAVLLQNLQEKGPHIIGFMNQKATASKAVEEIDAACKKQNSMVLPMPGCLLLLCDNFKENRGHLVLCVELTDLTVL